MSRAKRLAKSLIEVHNGHADEGATVFTEAAALLREQDAKLRQYEEVMRQAREALTATMSTHGFKKDIDRAHHAAIAAINEVLK